MEYLFVALTVLFWGITPVFDKIGMQGVSAPAALVVRSVAAACWVLIGTLAFARPTLSAVAQMPVRNTVALVIGALLASTLGVWTYFQAIRTLPLTKVVPLCSTYPLVAALVGVLFLGESLSATRLLGIVLIIAGVALVK